MPCCGLSERSIGQQHIYRLVFLRTGIGGNLLRFAVRWFFWDFRNMHGKSQGLPKKVLKFSVFLAYRQIIWSIRLCRITRIC